MRHTFHAEQWLPYPVELVFSFFANPENLPRLMPPWQKARIEEAAFTPPPPRPVTTSTALPKTIAAGAGTRIIISFRPFPYAPFRIPWEAEITEFAWNDHFCDRQLRGPFAYWNHCHTLQPTSRTLDNLSTQGALLHDVVEYELPAGRLGDIANTLFITRQLRSTFTYRQTRTQELLSLMRNHL
jgi:ligand-binding SRPBCC domain-containing protein